MNRIFKTVWNVARKALVVVNEKTGIGQSRCAARGASETVNSAVAKGIVNNQKQRFGVPSGLVMALAGVFVLWGGNVEAAKTFPTDCVSVGGTMRDGVCYIGDGEATVSIAPNVNDDWILSEGDMTIIADIAYGVFQIAYDSQVGSISNLGSGTLSILGGGNQSSGVGINANGEGSIGTISNVGTGTIKIEGGTGKEAYGIKFNAINNGKGAITNEHSGELIISGGIGEQSSGIYSNAGDPGDLWYKERGVGLISNSGDGKLLIIGGAGGLSYGIRYNSDAGPDSDVGSGTISNTGKGVLTIKGGMGGSNGIMANGYEGSYGFILNTGDGTLKIEGGGIGGNGWQGHGFISNRGQGNLLIAPIYDSALGYDFALEYNAYSSDSSSNGKILNEGSGNLFISGGADDAVGIIYNASGVGSNGEIQNTADGNLIITGGAGKNSHGIAFLTIDGWSFGAVSNSGKGTLTIQGGEGLDSYGIYCVGRLGGNGTISNGPEGWLNILGNKQSGSFGIGILSTGDYAISKGYIENAGILTLNAFAIQSFGDGDSMVTNKSTGTVNAEVGAIFVKENSSQTDVMDISVLQKREANWASDTAIVEGFNASSGSEAWALKEDWRLHSKWEDGGSLVITDVMEGSLAAQQIEAAFCGTFGTGTSLSFIGENDEASEGLAPKFSTDVANALIAQGYSGSVVTNFDLEASDASGNAQALIIGSEAEGAITDSIGFRQIQGASSVNVQNGKYLALIGSVESEELVAGGAPVTLDNGLLMLGVTPAGSARTDSSTAGSLESVTMKNGSKIETENMWVQVATVEGQGDVSLTETGHMHVGNMNVKGSVKNEGTLSADTLTVSGSLETSKTLKSSGTITVNSGSKLVADGYVVADKLDVKGVMIRGGKVNVFTGAAAMDLLREANAEAAAEVDRVEGKSEVSTMSVLDRIVAASMKKTTEDTTDDQTEAKEEAGKEESPKTPPVVITSHRRVAPVLPQDAQAFAAFDAVNRIASDINTGGSPDANGLWVKLLTGESEFGVRSGAKFEVDSDGAVIGAEAKLKPELKVGAALSYLDGEIDSGRAKNDWKSYGLTAYAHYKAGDFGVKGSAGWLHGTTEAAEDYDADVWHAGVRAEYDLVNAPLTVTPFMGARLMSGSFDGMASQTVVNLPLGLKLAGQLSTAGWTVTPALEASYVRSLGDTEAEDVRFLPKNAFTGALSLKAEKGAWTGELSLRGAAGSNDYEDRGFMAKVGYTF